MNKDEDRKNYELAHPVSLSGHRPDFGKLYTAEEKASYESWSRCPYCNRRRHVDWIKDGSGWRFGGEQCLNMKCAAHIEER